MKAFLTILLFLLIAGGSHAQVFLGLLKGTPAPTANIIYIGDSTASTTTTSASPVYNGNIQAGDIIVAFANSRPGETPPTTTGFTQVGSFSGGLAGTGNDAGSMTITGFIRIADGTETGNKLFTQGTGSTLLNVRMFVYRNAGGTWSVAATGGSDNTPGNSWSIAGGTLDLKPADLVLAFSAINTDNAYTYSNYSLEVPGITFDTPLIRSTGTSNVGDDFTRILTEHKVTAGTATGAAAYSFTSSGSAATNPAGASLLIRLRQVQ